MTRSTSKSAAQWAVLIEQLNKSTEVQRDFCERHNVKLAFLRKWRYLLKKQVTSDQPSSAFLKVDVRKPQSPKVSAVLHVGADIRLECPSSYDAAAFTKLVVLVQRGL